MKCIVCQNEFNSNYKHKRTCSESCSVVLKKTNHDKWVDENRDKHNANKRLYYKDKDKDKMKVRSKRYKNSPQGKKSRSAGHARRLLKDPLYRARRNLRKRLWSYKKEHGTMSMTKSIGCSWDEFKLHMESLFYTCPRTGISMTWDNYGQQKDPANPKWEIDHKTPLCVAIDAAGLEALSHYTNLQPMWHIDNSLKSLSDLKIKSETNLI